MIICTSVNFYSSFGNELEPTSNLLEVMFSICIVLCGLTLFTLLIGNIQVTYNFFFAWILDYVESYTEISLFFIIFCRWHCKWLWQEREKYSWEVEMLNGGWSEDSCRLVWGAEYAILNARDGQPWEKMNSTG